jgi:hypothetical protein
VISARSFFFAGGEDSDVEVLERSLHEQGALGTASDTVASLGAGTRSLLDREVAAVVAGMLDIGLDDVLLTGWQKLEALRDAGERSLATSPHGEELVELAQHTVSSTHSPHVDLLVNGKRIATIEATIVLSLAVDALVAVVSGGRLTALRSGSCLATLVVTVQDREVLRRERAFEAPLNVALGDGVDLVSSARR